MTGASGGVATCVYPHRDDQLRHGAVVGMLCRAGFGTLEQHIAELPALVGWLAANLPASSGGGLDPNRVTSSHDTPLVIEADIHDHLMQIQGVLRSWVQLVVEERILTGPREGSPSTTATFLIAHLPWIAAQPWVDDLAAEVADLHRDAHVLAPSRPRTYRLPARCPTCEQIQMTRRDGDDHVQCQSCGRLWTEREYLTLVHVLAEEQRNASGWVTPELVAADLGLNAKTVRSWAKRGLIAVVCAVLPGERDARWRVHPAEVAERVALREDDEQRSA